jgi:hypothetical protein
MRISGLNVGAERWSCEGRRVNDPEEASMTPLLKSVGSGIVLEGERWESGRPEEEPNPWRTSSFQHGFYGPNVGQTRAGFHRILKRLGGSNLTRSVAESSYHRLYGVEVAKTARVHIRDWVLAQMALYETQIVEVPQVFSSVRYRQDGKTVYEMVGNGCFSATANKITKHHTITE